MNAHQIKITQSTTYSAPRPRRLPLSLFPRAPRPDSRAAAIARAAVIEVLG